MRASAAFISRNQSQASLHLVWGHRPPWLNSCTISPDACPIHPSCPTLVAVDRVGSLTLTVPAWSNSHTTQGWSATPDLCGCFRCRHLRRRLHNAPMPVVMSVCQPTTRHQPTGVLRTTREGEKDEKDGRAKRSSADTTRSMASLRFTLPVCNSGNVTTGMRQACRLLVQNMEMV